MKRVPQGVGNIRWLVLGNLDELFAQPVLLWSRSVFALIVAEAGTRMFARLRVEHNRCFFQGDDVKTSETS